MGGGRPLYTRCLIAGRDWKSLLCGSFLG
jgi:hypothetical protein